MGDCLDAQKEKRERDALYENDRIGRSQYQTSSLRLRERSQQILPSSPLPVLLPFHLLPSRPLTTADRGEPPLPAIDREA